MNQLQDLLNHYSEFRILSKKDNDKIMRFFNQTSMETTSLKLRYERTPDFFSFLDYQSDEVFVMGGDKDEKDIKAIATMTIRDGFINGQLKRVAYLGDLRVRGGIRYSMRWQQLFGDILENSKKLEDVNVDYFITAVMAGNAKASKALVKNKNSKFKYKKLCDYKMVNVVMPYKKLASLRDVEIRWATVDDKEKLLDFLEYKNKNRPFGFSREYMERAFDKWTHFSIENFIILKKNSRIVSTCAIWNPSPAKKIIIESLPRSLKILNALVSPFTKTSKVGEELKVQYLNFLNLGHKDDLKIIFEFLRIEKIFKQYDLIAFADFEPFNYREGLKGLIMDLTPLELYRVELRESRETSKVCWTKPPAFEISLV